MNKIKVDEEKLIVNNEDILLDSIDKNLELHLEGQVNCGIKELKPNANLDIYLAENSFSNIELFLKLNHNCNKITIHNSENTKMNLNLSAIFTGENALEIRSNISSSNVHNKIKVRLVEEQGNINLLATGNIESNTKDINYLEDIKAIVENNETITIMPELLGSSEYVTASHNATISKIDELELFYLESKGLEKEEASFLIKKGFLKGILINKELGGEDYE